MLDILMKFTLWESDIALENSKFPDGYRLPVEHGDF